MQAAGHIGWRNDDGVGRVLRAAACERIAGFPTFIEARLDFGGRVCLFEVRHGHVALRGRSIGRKVAYRAAV